MRSVVVALVVLSATGCGGDEAVPDAPSSPPDAAVDAASPDAAAPDAEPTDLVIGEPFGPPDDAVGPALDGSHAAIAWNGTDFVLLEQTIGVGPSDVLVRWLGADGTFHGARQALAGDDLEVGGLTCRTDGTCAYGVYGGFGDPSHKLVLLTGGGGGDDNAQPPFVELPAALSQNAPFVGAHGTGYVAVGGTVGVERYQRVTAGGLLIDLAPVDIDVGPDRAVHEDLEPIFACDDDGCTLVMSTVGAGGDDVRIMRFHAGGDVDAPVVVPGVLEAEGFACAGATCLIAEQRAGSSLLRGLRVDRGGAPIGGAFTIATLAAGSRSVHVGADATGFVVTTGVGVTDAAPGRMHAIRVGLDGSVGADLDVMPTASDRSDLALADGRRDGVACSPARCVLVATIDGSRIVARLDGTTIVDDPPVVVVAPAAMRELAGTHAPDHALLTWRERRIIDDTPAWSLRAARIGATGWIAPASTALPGNVVSAFGWTGSGYLGIAADGAIVRLDADGAVVGAAPAIPGAFGIACRARCLVGLASGGGVLVEPDGSVVPDSTFTGPRGAPIAFEASSTPGGFALVSTDAGLDVAIVTATGVLISTIDVAEALPVSGGNVGRAVVDGTLIIAWHSAGTTVARAIGPDLALSAAVDLGPDIELESSAPLGHAALFTWHDSAARTYRAVRVDPALALLEPPFELAAGPFDAGSVPVAASSGTAVSVAFTHLDPTTDVRFLTVIPVRLE